MSLGRLNLPRHITAEKNWDMFHLHKLADPFDRATRAVDLGCGGLCTLKLLCAMGFQNLHGVDLNVRCVDRAAQLIHMWRSRTLNPPFKLHRMDLTHTRFAAGSFDLATCVSVIEHGVSFQAFLSEANRILKPGGLLFVTADYWEDAVDVSDVSDQYNLPWTILARQDIERLIDLADQHGFQLYEDEDNRAIPTCDERCIVWQQKEYTAIAIALIKKDSSAT